MLKNHLAQQHLLTVEDVCKKVVGAVQQNNSDLNILVCDEVEYIEAFSFCVHFQKKKSEIDHLMFGFFSAFFEIMDAMRCKFEFLIVPLLQLL